MNKRNYQRELDRLIEGLEKEEKVPTLFLHSCCAPCSSYVLEYLSKYFKITVFYYNPNIYPPEEYGKRVEEQKNLIAEMAPVHPISFQAGDYDSSCFYSAVKGLEKEPEGGKRCEACFRLRLTEAAGEAKKGGFDYFTTTLSISPLKNAEVLNTLGEEIGREYGVSYLFSDFKKKGGYQRSVELSKEYGLYRQDYCGCVYSMRKEEDER